MFKGIFGIHCCLQAKSGDKRSADGVKKTEKGAVSFFKSYLFHLTIPSNMFCLYKLKNACTENVNKGAYIILLVNYQ